MATAPIMGESPEWYQKGLNQPKSSSKNMTYETLFNTKYNAKQEDTIFQLEIHPQLLPPPPQQLWRHQSTPHASTTNLANH